MLTNRQINGENFNFVSMEEPVAIDAGPSAATITGDALGQFITSEIKAVAQAYIAPHNPIQDAGVQVTQVIIQDLLTATDTGGRPMSNPSIITRTLSTGLGTLATNLGTQVPYIAEQGSVVTAGAFAAAALGATVCQSAIIGQGNHRQVPLREALHNAARDTLDVIATNGARALVNHIHSDPVSDQPVGNQHVYDFAAGAARRIMHNISTSTIQGAITGEGAVQTLNPVITSPTTTTFANVGVNAIRRIPGGVASAAAAPVIQAVAGAPSRAQSGPQSLASHAVMAGAGQMISNSTNVALNTTGYSTAAISQALHAAGPVVVGAAVVVRTIQQPHHNPIRSTAYVTGQLLKPIAFLGYGIDSAARAITNRPVVPLTDAWQDIETLPSSLERAHF